MTTPASSTSPSPSSLLLFAPAQNPLPVRYPHPHKPRLLLPALVHRALHSALDGDAPSFSVQSTDASKGKGSTVIIPHPDVIVKQDEPVREDKSNGAGNGSSIVGSNVATTDAPSTIIAEETGLSTGPEGLVGAQVESEITFKLHLVGGPSSSSSSSSSASPTPTAAEIATERSQWVSEALSVAAQYKGLSRVDTLLIGFKGVDYKGKKTAVSEFFGCGAEGIEGGSGVENVSQEVEEEVLATWTKVRQEVVPGGKLGDVKVGTLYLPLGVLRRLTEEAGKGEQAQPGGANGQDAGRRGPVINMLDTPDCHSLPKEYTAYAKEQDIALWAGGGGEGADPLPDADLHNVLHEFQPLLSSSILSNQVPTGLDKLIPLREDELKYETEPKPALAVKWALGYTVISKSRNVVKDKG